ncbi:sugar transferase [Thomasclavelia ramosa]|uniref:sugar transferase n=1 Tax=Thomasclavelia ramosa TaxID=1547 RepID=UPI002343155E|nr:sugar transferase [Thomasclavelia ramosa]
MTDKQKKYLLLKRGIDIVLSGGAIVVLSPILGLLALAIKLDSPGSVLFKQKRVGKNKELFEIYKFRTMRTDTPSDMPTHMLKNPDQFITKTGKFLRKTSLDELPQIFNIFTGKMSVIGPRPALWNQDDLIAERDKYHANDVTPGLTGWAQINGRDELEIDVKAKFDGDYVNEMGLKMDIKCFLATIGSVLLHDGVVEGGTGELEKTVDTQIVDPEKIDKEAKIGAAVVGGASIVGLTGLGLICNHIKNKDNNKDKKSHKGLILGSLALGYAAYTTYTNVKRKVQLQDNFINKKELKQTQEDKQLPLKKVLITGANSYIGESVEKWLNNSDNEYEIDTLDMLDPNWKERDFSKYDTVFHVAGIAHADVGNVSEDVKQKYYQVNTDLTLEVANKAKEARVKQFIFMSSMIVYSGCDTKHIIKDTKPKAENFYGDSKLQADLKLQEMNDVSFKVVVVRPPMIYGKGSKGNYPQLAKLATKLPIFPIVDNKRSMLRIDNLCEFIRLMIDNEESGVFFPQNNEYTNTSDMVQMIANVKGHRIVMLPGTSLAIKLLEKVPGKMGGLASKAFGDSYYDMDMSKYENEYVVNNLKESIICSEKSQNNNECKKALMYASVASMIDLFNMDNIHILQSLGFQVDVACNFKNGSITSNERVEEFKKELRELGVNIHDIPIPRSMFKINDILKSLILTKRLYNNNNYQFVHCHSPIGGVVSRLAAITYRKRGLKVIYTAHGFHFFKGAPLKNWILFYPIEKICSNWTDVLITINNEDFNIANDKFKANNVIYVPGIGVHVDEIQNQKIDIDSMRKELGLKSDDYVIMSIGQISIRKNQKVIIEAISLINNPKVKYVIVGFGELEEELQNLANKLNVIDRVIFTGYRQDAKALLHCADLFAFPSLQEGLPASLMEAMSVGLPVVCSDIRGNNDLIENDIGGYLCNSNDYKSFAKKIDYLLNNKDIALKMGKYNQNNILNYDTKVVIDEMKNIYNGLDK